MSLVQQVLAPTQDELTERSCGKMAADQLLKDTMELILNIFASTSPSGVFHCSALRAAVIWAM